MSNVTWNEVKVNIIFILCFIMEHFSLLIIMPFMLHKKSLDDNDKDRSLEDNQS